MSVTTGSTYLVAFKGSMLLPHNTMFHPKTFPPSRSSFWSKTLSAQSPTGFSPLNGTMNQNILLPNC